VIKIKFEKLIDVGYSIPQMKECWAYKNTENTLSKIYKIYNGIPVKKCNYMFDWKDMPQLDNNGDFK